MLRLTRCKGSRMTLGSTAPRKIATPSDKAKASSRFFRAGSTECFNRTDRMTTVMLNSTCLLPWSPIGRVDT